MGRYRETPSYIYDEAALTNCSAEEIRDLLDLAEHQPVIIERPSRRGSRGNQDDVVIIPGVFSTPSHTSLPPVVEKTRRR